MRIANVLSLLCGSFLGVTAAASFLLPPVLPLSVRTPYLQTWYNARAAPYENWPFFLNGDELGFGILAKINTTVYPLLGRPQDGISSTNGNFTVIYPVFNGFQYDAQTTTLDYTLGSTGVQLIFTAPITPDSIERQSIPAVYFEVKVTGKSDLSLYVDLNGMWVTGDRGATVQWTRTQTSSLQTWAFERQTQLLYSQHDQWEAEWGTMYFTAANDEGITYQSECSGPLRTSFAKTGTLNNTIDTQFRGVMDDEPVFAFSKFFAANSTDRSTLFTFTYVQDPVAQFAAARGLTQMRPLWQFYWATEAAMIDFHYNDYKKAVRAGQVLADKINSEATELVSANYADILALSARQTMAATAFSGTPSQPILFQKEISSNGDMQTVDVIWPAFPFFLYINPDWLAYMLEPLLENQQAGLYPNAWSIHDLGRYPNATGYPRGDDEPMPVEESGNMLIMALAYVLSLNDTSRAREWINRDGRYTLWKQWTAFLVEDGLIPADQLSTDDFAGTLANQTDLAMKAVVGIRAMAKLAEAMGETADAANFTKISDSYLPQIIQMSLSRDYTHTKLAYQWYGSWGTLYNQFGDAILCFHVDEPKGFVPYDLYRNQSAWYYNVRQQYGLPLDSRHLYAKSDWEMWAAAISSEQTRQAIVDEIASWINDTVTDRPLTDLYDTVTTDFPGITFEARPVVGAHFGVLALNNACNGTGFTGLKAIFEGRNGTESVQGQSEPYINVAASLESDRQLAEDLGLIPDRKQGFRKRPGLIKQDMPEFKPANQLMGDW